MNITTEYSPEREAIVTVEIDAERLQRAIVHASQTISRVRPMPGFRPGKAPLAVVEQAVGRDLLLDEALEELSHDLYREILKSQDLDPVDRGRSEVVQKDPPILKFTVPLRPEVKLGDYQTLQMRPPEVTITEDEVDQVIARFLRDGPTEAELTRAKSQLAAAAIYAQDSQEALANMYGSGLVRGEKLERVRRKFARPQVYPWAAIRNLWGIQEV